MTLFCCVLQMGYSDMGEIEQQLYGDLDDDAELEAELLALQGEPGGGRRASPRGRPGEFNA